ncbi:oligosaccharide flippase family protein, partial [Desulfobacterales bacterium HSG17]|nr:oligosaccharide flippase family protein [Desulfobacterales bacterium HSG17]
IMNADILLIGKLLDMERLAFYNLGKNFGEMVVTFITHMIHQAYLPALSTVSEDLLRITRIYRRTITFFIMITVPVSMVIVLFSHDIIRLLYDPRYQAAHVSMYVLCLCGIFRTIGLVSGVTFIAVGKPVLETISMAVGVVLIMVLIPVGANIKGLFGGAAGAFGALFMVVVIESVYLWRSLKFPLLIVIRPWFQAGFLIGVIGLVYFLLKPWLTAPDLYNIPFAVLIGIVGLAVSAGVYRLLEGRHPFRDEGEGR